MAERRVVGGVPDKTERSDWSISVVTLICGSEYANSEQSIHVLKESHVLMFTPEISRKITTKCVIIPKVFHGLSPKDSFKKTPTYIL